MRRMDGDDEDRAHKHQSVENVECDNVDLSFSEMCRRVRVEFPDLADRWKGDFPELRGCEGRGDGGGAGMSKSWVDDSEDCRGRHGEGTLAELHGMMAKKQPLRHAAHPPGDNKCSKQGPAGSTGRPGRNALRCLEGSGLRKVDAGFGNSGQATSARGTPDHLLGLRPGSTTSRLGPSGSVSGGHGGTDEAAWRGE